MDILPSPSDKSNPFMSHSDHVLHHLVGTGFIIDNNRWYLGQIGVGIAHNCRKIKIVLEGFYYPCMTCQVNYSVNLLSHHVTYHRIKN